MYVAYSISTQLDYRIAGIFLREKIFANYRLFAKILSANDLFFVDKDRPIALIHSTDSRNPLFRAFAKISPAKMSRYTVSHACK